MDSAIQSLNNRDLVSESVCLYMQLICAIFYERGFTLLDSSMMSFAVTHCIYDLCFITKWETQWQSTYLTFSNTPKGKPMHIVAASLLCSEICFSHPYSTIQPNAPLLLHASFIHHTKISPCTCDKNSPWSDRNTYRVLSDHWLYNFEDKFKSV